MNKFNAKILTTKFKWITAALLSTLLSLNTTALAQAYPNKPIQLIVGWPPGGGADIVARIMAEGLSASLNQTVTVSNRPGASGNLGAETAARSAPDGYTILLVGGNHVTNIHLYQKLGYDPMRDFEPISLLTVAPNLLVVNPSLPVRNVAEFVALARSKPNQLSYGSAGNGTTGHLAMELLKSTTKIDIVHIPYKGAAPFITDLIGSQVMLGFDGIGSTGPQIKNGRLRAIATSDSKRTALFPDVPTVAESGYPGFEVLLWQGLLAPAGTPRDVINRLNAAVQETLNRPATLKRFNELALESTGGTPEQFRAFLTNEISKWGGVIRTIGVKLD